MMKNKSHERGSIVFYILLGCALFAALTYAVNQTIRVNNGVGGGIGDAEKLSLTATEIKQYMESLKMQVAQMTTGNGISESSLDFRNDVYKLENGNNNTGNVNSNCTDSSCQIFTPYNPNGLRAMIFDNAADTTPQSSATLPKNGHGQVKQISINGVGSSAPDLVFIIHGIKADLCNYYNHQDGITTTYDSSTTLTSIGESGTTSVPAPFTGAFNTSNDFGNGATAFTGKKTFCAPTYVDSANSRLAIWQILKIR